MGKTKVETTKRPIEEVMEELEQGIKSVFESEKYKEMLRMTAKFHRYSLNNCILIAMQRPDATYVAGYQTWQKTFRRVVNKGEKGIRILAPAPYKVEKEKDQTEENGKPVLDENGRPKKEKVTITVPAYRVAYVFDVSQTSGEPLPEIVETLDGNVENYVMYKSVLEKIAPCPVRYEHISGGANGYYSLDEKVVVVDENLSEEQILKTLIHEITHAKLHDKDTGADKDVCRNAAEVEAESVAYIVSEHLGIDSSQYSFGYVAGWSAGKELPELKACLSVIHDTATELIEQIDRELELTLKPKAEEMEQTIERRMKMTI